MSAFVFAAMALLALTAATLLRPWWWRRRPKVARALDEKVRMLRQQLAQVDELHRSGALTDEQHAHSRQHLERGVVEAVCDIPAPDAKAGDAGPGARPSGRLAVAMVAFVALVGGGGYFGFGSPAQALRGSSDAPIASEGGARPAHPLTDAEVADMVERLAQRLEAKPDDAEGWQMLARSNAVLGRHADAVAAFAQASRLQPANADLLADYADALAMSNGRQLAGEPMALIRRALGIEPAHPKALALAGTAAFDRKDYREAASDWERAVNAAPDAPLAQQLREGIVEARRLAGEPVSLATASTASTAAGAAPATGGPAARPAEVSGTVILAESLKGRVGPDDTLFVFAREPGSRRMPLAVLRKRVRDLPLQFRLDDSLAMSTDARLSSASRVVVSARISKSGDAAPQAGDLQGQVDAVAVGANDVRVEIDAPVAK